MHRKISIFWYAVRRTCRTSSVVAMLGFVELIFELILFRGVWLTLERTHGKKRENGPCLPNFNSSANQVKEKQFSQS